MIRIKGDDGYLHTVMVGDYVGFKYDVEQSGEVVAINNGLITVRATEGGYVHVDNCHEDCEGCETLITKHADEIWVD